MKNLTLVAVAATILVPSSAIAQRAIVDVYGCGTNCRIEVKQLSVPSLFKPSKFNGEWAKVLFQSSCIVQKFNGIDLIDQGRCVGGKSWKFAECKDGLIGFGKASDMSDATIRSVYSGSGQKRTATVDGSIYYRWEALCKAFSGQ